MSIELDRCTLLFQELGLTRIEGRILYVLLTAGNPLSARNIERIADMRQPELSIGLKKLLDRGWVTERADKSVTGRSVKVFALSTDKEQIYEDLRIGYSIRVESQKSNILELKELLNVR